MNPADRKALVAIIVVILIGILVAFAGSQGGSLVFGMPLFAALVGLSFLIQWLVFMPAYLLQSEKFFDLTGSLTYVSIITIGLALGSEIDVRSLLLWAMVVIWAIRLGAFLFGRIKKAGKDDRFDELKPSFFRFLNVWTIQGLWVTFTMAAALVAITSTVRKELDIFALVGSLIWVLGFVFEVVADNQKSRFSANPDNKGKFIQTGLWSRSRHPNYFGEIMLWLGVAIVTIPVLEGWQWIAFISPVFVTFLLTRVSGVPLLEKKAEKKWGGQEAYEAYKKSTPPLFPRL